MLEAAPKQPTVECIPAGILTTGYDMDDSEVQSVLKAMQELQAGEFMMKPFNIRTLTEGVQRMTGSSLTIGNGIVVHVEDDMHIRKLVDVVLKREAIPHISFATYDEALEALQGGMEEVRVLILDLITPGKASPVDLIRYFTSR